MKTLAVAGIIAISVLHGVAIVLFGWSNARAADTHVGPRWVLVVNPRFGTVDATPNDRRYVWVLEDRATGLNIADPAIARQHLPAPGPISSTQRLAEPSVSVVNVKPLNRQSSSQMGADSNTCRLNATQEIPETPVATDAFWKFPIGGLVGIAIETEKARVRQLEYSNRAALDAYRSCMIERGYEVDGVATISKGAGVLATIEAECTAEWPNDAAKRRECEDDRLADVRFGRIRPR